MNPSLADICIILQSIIRKKTTYFVYFVHYYTLYTFCIYICKRCVCLSVGMLDDRHAVKRNPEVGMVVCKIGGPAYRIGLGGGAASSRGQGTVDAALDFNAVQRGDAEMENRMNRFVRSCVELGDGNPIMSIHDQVGTVVVLVSP